MRRWVPGVALLCGCGLVGCGAGGEGDPDGAPTFTGVGPGTSGAGGTNPPNNSAGSSNGGPGSMQPVGNGSGGSNGAPVASAGSTGEGNGGVGSLAPGNNPGSGGNGVAGSGSQPPPGGSSGQPDPSGPFVSVPTNGGASAAFVCPDGPFGNPLQGMGAVQSIEAPDGEQDFSFVEGPVWVGSQNRLFFSDNTVGRIWELAPPFTTAASFLENTGANGLAVDNDDRLLVADQSAGRITRFDLASKQLIDTVVPSGNFTPNDLVLRSDENLYFTDPNSGGRGFYRASPSGQVDGPFSQSNTEDTPGAPNGVVLSPDENLLYVGDVQQRFVSVLELEADGTIDTASARVFVRTTGDTVDGMAVDCAGNLYVGTRTGVEVYAPDATLIGIVPTGESSNATFGGADRRTLFVTSRFEVRFVTLGVPGLPD